MLNSPFSPEHLTGPSDLIACLPGVLGFYPHESVVVLGLHSDTDPSCVTLGPVLRADLTHAAELCAALRDLPAEGCIGYYALLVTRIPDSDLAREAGDALFNAGDSAGSSLIDACWTVSEIATGTPYRIVFGPGPGALAADPLGPHWISGAVSSVMGSPAMRALLDNGILPELNREDTFSYFDVLEPADDGERDSWEALGRLAVSRGTDLLARVAQGDRAAAAAAAEACLVLHSAPARPLVSPWEGAETRDLLGEEDDRLALATMLSRSMLRDRLLNDALTFPLPAAHALLCVAKTFTGVIRANALSIWAVIAVDRGLTPWAVAALTVAQTELPGHNLSGVLLSLVRTGHHEKLTEAARLGCDAAWAGDAGLEAS
ncbi:DUF4192 domain-containing protein [Corynebacterium sp. UBA2622]|uniref:DUF4192 domain-containing protein n=1 Tax=Corynebacterium sp. UBA2622 TaxID=1946393 RepID=UPI0025BBF488|nr:DUF4192 domain-containing protein [Corynebacterium sp. UBA2622]